MMKKSLLTIAVALTATVMNAQTWTTPATWEKTLNTDVNPSVKVDTDGAAYITGTYNTPLTFGSSMLANDDKMESAFVAKYNADGTEAWAVGFYGNAEAASIDLDAEGNLYVAVNIYDEVVITGTDGQATTIATGDENHGGVLVAKIDKSGIVKTTKVIISATNEEIASVIAGDGEDAYPMYGGWEPIFVEANKLKVANGKVYVSASYTGDVEVDNLSWSGSYINVDDMMYADNRSEGVFSLSAADLSGAESVANVQMTGKVDYAQYFPEGIGFAVTDAQVHVGFFGFGNLTLTTDSGTENLTFESDGEGTNEHAFVLANIPLDNTNHAYSYAVFNATPTENLNNFYSIADMVVENNNLYIAGTYSNAFPFDEEKTSTGNSDIFAVSFNTLSNNINWAVVSGYDEGTESESQEIVSSLTVNNGKVFVTGAGATVIEDNMTGKPLAFNIESDGSVTTQTTDFIYIGIDDNKNGKTFVVTGSGKDYEDIKVALYNSPVVTGIQTVKNGTTNDEKIYNLNGQQVTTPTKGLYIVGGKKVIY